MGARVQDPSAGAPRVTLVRESLWLVPIPRDRSDRVALADRRGRLALSAYALYTDAASPADVEAFVVPVLRAMATSRSRSMLVLTEHAATFDAGRVRHALQAAHACALPTSVEITGTWPSTLLELLAAASPSYVRLAPELVRGAATLPDVFRSLVRLAEFAHERGLELVARNPGDEHDLDAARVAGVGLVQWGGLPLLGRRGGGRLGREGLSARIRR